MIYSSNSKRWCAKNSNSRTYRPALPSNIIDYNRLKTKFNFWTILQWKKPFRLIVRHIWRLCTGKNNNNKRKNRRKFPHLLWFGLEIGNETFILKLFYILALMYVNHTNKFWHFVFYFYHNATFPATGVTVINVYKSITQCIIDPTWKVFAVVDVLHSVFFFFFYLNFVYLSKGFW